LLYQLSYAPGLLETSLLQMAYASLRTPKYIACELVVAKMGACLARRRVGQSRLVAKALRAG
jgi:hypothetical protein